MLGRFYFHMSFFELEFSGYVKNTQNAVLWRFCSRLIVCQMEGERKPLSPCLHSDPTKVEKNKLGLALWIVLYSGTVCLLVLHQFGIQFMDNPFQFTNTKTPNCHWNGSGMSLNAIQQGTLICTKWQNKLIPSKHQAINLLITEAFLIFMAWPKMWFMSFAARDCFQCKTEIHQSTLLWLVLNPAIRSWIHPELNASQWQNTILTQNHTYSHLEAIRLNYLTLYFSASIFQRDPSLDVFCRYRTGLYAGTKAHVLRLTHLWFTQTGFQVVQLNDF